MANTLLTPNIIAKESLMVLENELVLAGLVHRAYSSEFQKVGSTVTIRKPTTFTSSAVSNTVNLSTATESSVNVVLNQHLDITFNVSTQELSLNVVDFSEQFIQPVMRAHAQKVDTLIAALYADVAGHYAVSSTPAVSDIAGVRAVMNVLKVPLQERRLVMHPITEADYLVLGSFLNAEKRGDTQAIKDASMGRVLGFDCYMDQNIVSHASTAPFNAAGTCLIKGAWAVDATAGTVDSSTGAIVGTAEVGDCFKVTGYDQWFTVVAEVAPTTAGVMEMTEFQPPVNATIADNSVVTFQLDHRANLAFHKNAFALVTAPLEPPLGGTRAAVLNYKGLSCRVCYDYTMMTKQNIISVDMLCGVKTLDRNLAARLVDAR